MSRYYRNNPDEQISFDWCAGGGARRKIRWDIELEKQRQADFRREEEKESVYTRPNESIVDVDSV